MLVLARVVATVILLNDFGLLVKELGLLVLTFSLLLLHELATAQVPPPDTLHLPCGALLVIVFPLRLKHLPGLLNDLGSRILLVSKLLSLIKTSVILIDEGRVASLPLFEKQSHLFII